jgi:Rps23 Pro-64 3,4-dihydroxylase Tpa1-like proline 4-hydroxylase
MADVPSLPRCPADHPIFEPAALDALGDGAIAFQQAEPFRHAVIDGLFRPEFLREVERSFYPVDDARWQRFGDPSRQVKLALQSDYHQPPAARALIHELNAEPFLRRLGQLTGLVGLVPDPYLEGAGLHQIAPGGKLAVHADFNKHSIMNLDRRLNLIVYLNEHWEDAWGGHLELWDREMTRAVTRVAPAFNRTIVFLTDDYSYHGHPDPLACPPDRARRSVAMYYYTNGRPASEINADAQHSTLFRERPGEAFAPEPVDAAGALKKRLKESLPAPVRALGRRLLGRDR